MGIVLCAALSLGARPARDRDTYRGPGVYGKLDSAMLLGVSAGGGFAAGGSLPVTPAASVESTFLFLGTAALTVGYDFGAREVASGVTFTRHSLRFAIDLRPLFLPMMFGDLFTGSEFLDLLIYSLSFEIGGAFERGSLSSSSQSVAENGGGFFVGTGFDIPLTSRGGSGFSLRIAVRVRYPSNAPLERAQALGLWSGTDMRHVEVLLLVRHDFAIGGCFPLC
jgi:hypothetical protein